MSAEQTRSVIEKELGGAKLEQVFEWIDLEEPLGSASLAQVCAPSSVERVQFQLNVYNNAVGAGRWHADLGEGSAERCWWTDCLPHHATP